MIGVRPAVTLTGVNNLRCSLRPELIAAVTAGPPTTVRLTNGVSLAVRESTDEVQRQLDRLRRRRGAASPGQERPAAGHWVSSPGSSDLVSR